MQRRNSHGWRRSICRSIYIGCPSWAQHWSRGCNYRYWRTRGPYPGYRPPKQQDFPQTKTGERRCVPDVLPPWIFPHAHPLPRVVGDLGDALSRDRVFGVWPIAFSGYCIPSRFGQFELCWDSHALSIQQKTTPYCQNQNRQ